MPSLERRHKLGAAIGALVIVLAVAITVVINSRDHSPADPPWPRSIVFYGDSLTRGSFTTTPQQAFPEQVVAALADSGDKPTSTTVADYGIGVDEFLRRTPRPPSAPDLFVVELGTNDLGKQDASAFASTYGRLLDRLGTTTSHALICLGPWAPPQITGPLEASISGACAQHGGRYLAISDLYADAANRGPAGLVLQGLPTDDVHPNDIGHSAIAQRVRTAAEALRPRAN